MGPRAPVCLLPVLTLPNSENGKLLVSVWCWLVREGRTQTGCQGGLLGGNSLENDRRREKGRSKMQWPEWSSTVRGQVQAAQGVGEGGSWYRGRLRQVGRELQFGRDAGAVSMGF